MHPHLRVQLTLTSSFNGGRHAGSATEFKTVLAASRQHFPAVVRSREPVHPGGAAVHCEVTFLAPDTAVGHFPAGSQFEVWENGRKGYGTVLRVL